jgi:hypothetical protein
MGQFVKFLPGAGNFARIDKGFDIVGVVLVIRLLSSRRIVLDLCPSRFQIVIQGHLSIRTSQIHEPISSLVCLLYCSKFCEFLRIYLASITPVYIDRGLANMCP